MELVWMSASIRESMSPRGKGGRVGEMQSFVLEMGIYYGDSLNIWQHLYLTTCPCCSWVSEDAKHLEIIDNCNIIIDEYYWNKFKMHAGIHYPCSL